MRPTCFSTLGCDELEWPAIAALARKYDIREVERDPILDFPYRYGIPGQGEFPLEELKTAISPSSYRELFCLEWERRWHPYLPPLEQALQEIFAYTIN